MWEPKYVTVVSGESPDYTVDGLADGFMRWLGKERVHLHLEVTASAQTSEFTQLQPVYAWNQACQTLPWNPCESELLVVSTRKPDVVWTWVETQRFQCPVASIDSRDTPIHETHICSLDGLSVVAFKREVSYTTMDLKTFPCPTGLIPDPVVSLRPYRERSIPVAFMGGSSNLTRSAIVWALQKVPGAKVLFNDPLPRHEYLDILQDSKIGVSCYGSGFENYRYWEVPQAGCLLVAQAPPIMIPNNFRNGHHALFYISPIEMLEAIHWALTHEDQAEAIALAGTTHLHQYHESTHRAQWVASMVADRLGSPEETKMAFPF